MAKHIRPETEEAQLIQFGDDHDPVHPRRGAARFMNQAYLQKDVGEGSGAVFAWIVGS